MRKERGEFPLKLKKPKSDGFWRVLAPSFLSIIVCAFFLAGLTLAWFSSSVQTDTEKIGTTWFQGTVHVLTRDGDPIDSVGGVYTLKKGTYDVNFGGITSTSEGRPNGVSLGNGFAVVEVYSDIKNDWEEIATVGIHLNVSSYNANPVQLKVNADDQQMRVRFGWGELTTEETSGPVEISYPDHVTAALLNAEKFSNTTSPDPSAETYTVQSDETLSSIAERFGTTTDKLAAYNNITNHDHVEAGQTLKIPPKDYEIPGETEPEGESAPAEPVTETPETAHQPETTAGTTASTEPPAATESPKPTEPAATEAGPQETEPKPVETEPAETTDASESEPESSEPQPASEDEPDESTTASETTVDEPRE